MEKNNYPKWILGKIFSQVKFINGSNLSLSTIETIEVPTNKSETVTKKLMLLLPNQGDKGIGLTKSFKRNLINTFLITLRRKLHLLVKNLALNSMLRIGPNLNTNMLFILVNVQDRIVLIITLVNLLGESQSEL